MAAHITPIPHGGEGFREGELCCSAAGDFVGSRAHAMMRAVSPRQLVTSILVVALTAMVCSVIAFRRGTPRKWAFAPLLFAGIFSIAAWTDYGRIQTIQVDASPGLKGSTRPKVARKRVFHFHEFVHYYVGAKYFREIGYLGLYDCVTLADREIATDDGTAPRIAGYIRDLEDVLRDKPYEAALTSCREGPKKNFSAERWAEFKADIRLLQQLVDDGSWQGVVGDAGFNPPPSLILVSSPIANLIPIRSGETDTFLFATCIDLLLLVICAIAVYRGFGSLTVAVWAVFFGATYVSHYTWNGGSLLRFSWLTSVVLGLFAVRRQRWALAGAFFALATCDRIFPIAFGAGAMIPIAASAIRSAPHRLILKRFGLSFAITAGVLVVASTLVYGVSAWRVFFTRTIHHSDVYYVMHLGLKKVLTFRSWVPSQNFWGHEGLARFRDWNLHLRATWASMRPLTILVQLLALAGVVSASLRRKPHEAALLAGVAFMFFFNLPANYYYVVLSLVPALLFRAAATETTDERKFRSLATFAGFVLFWSFTFVAYQMWPDGIVMNHYLCVALLIFLFGWMAAWTERAPLLKLRAALRR